MSSAFWNFFDCSTPRKTTLSCTHNNFLFLIIECNIPRRVPPGLPVVRSVRHVSLLPDCYTRTRLQSLQYRRYLRVTVTRHRHILQPYCMSNTQKNEERE